jgi:hypothetical protein
LRIEIIGITKRPGLTEALPSSRPTSPEQATTAQREQRRFLTDRGRAPRLAKASSIWSGFRVIDVHVAVAMAEVPDAI